jgi:hypothetical protein
MSPGTAEATQTTSHAPKTTRMLRQVVRHQRLQNITSFPGGGQSNTVPGRSSFLRGSLFRESFQSELGNSRDRPSSGL